MTINNPGNIGPLMPQNTPNNVADVNAAKKAPAPEKNEAAQGGVIRDKVEISRQAKTISKALNVINNLPDIREQAVEKAVQDRVIENNRVPAATLAAKLLLED
jgi:predicted outer membrane protein